MVREMVFLSCSISFIVWKKLIDGSEWFEINSYSFCLLKERMFGG